MVLKRGNGMFAAFVLAAVVLAGCDGKVRRVTDVTKIETYLAQYSGAAPGSAARPAELALNLRLTAENWMAILNSLGNLCIRVRLDLSDCKRGPLATGGGLRNDGVFDTNLTTEFGQRYIEEIILPRAAVAIVDSAKGKGAFKGFSQLKAASGENITRIGDYAFFECRRLETARFPRAAVIGPSAFRGTGLTGVSFPAVTDIGAWAFRYCDALTDVSFPLATRIGEIAFYQCNALASASFPLVTSIGDYAFNGCRALTSVNIPASARIGDRAFDDTPLEGRMR